MTATWEGMLPVDKPAGPTSHDVVALVRRATGERRVGHTGTLDPPASGLLLLLLGRATRLAGYVPSSPKEYTGTLRLGVTTLTDDLAGAVTSRHEGPVPSDAEVLGAASGLRGPGMQVPPAISARHVQGQRLYRAARRGLPLRAPATAIEVFRFEIAPTSDSLTWTFDASVSSGTFVRGLVRDLGAALGCGAAVASLRRTRIATLDVTDAAARCNDAATLARALVPLDRVPLIGQDLALPSEDAAGFAHGRRLTTEASDGIVALRDGAGRLLGIGRSRAGILEPRVVLAASASRSVAPPEVGVIPSTRPSS